MAALAPLPNPSRPATSLKTDATIISLVGFAHGSSHFYHLMLPPLFPWLIKEFGVSFTEVGALMTTFFVVSGIGQAFAGVWVDRFGAQRVLCAGLALLAASGLCIFWAPGFAWLFGAAFVAGLGNSVFHPADFALLNRRVSAPRLGHAFSVHGVAGNLGWAASPVLLTLVATAYGWRAAGLAAAAVGAISLSVLIWHRGLLQYPLKHAAAADKPTGTWDFLGTRMVWLAFTFFIFSTLGFGALQNFGPSLLSTLYGLTIASAASALSVYLVSASVGLIVGGFMVKESRAFEYVVAGSLCAGAVMAFILAIGGLPGWFALMGMGMMGFFVGIASPSRDMLVRTATKARLGEAAFGRVYGFVYSGLDVGLAVAPLVFGALLDRQMPHFVFVGVGAALVLAVIAAVALGRDAAGGVIGATRRG